MEDLATRIRRMREQKNLTQEYVAEQLGISVRTYRQLEYKDGIAAHLLSLQRLQKLALVLEVPISDFLFETPGNQSDMPAPPSLQDYESLKKENAQLSERLHASQVERAKLLGIVEQLATKNA